MTGTGTGTGTDSSPLFPASVVHVEMFHDPPDAVLFPEEEALIARAVPKRRREFTTARLCAREALARLGYPAAPILRDPRGAPLWPEGVVGSLTHCAGYRAAAVAHRTDLVALGLDAEPNAPLPDRDTLALIALPGERDHLAELAAAHPDLEVHWDRLLFSAKESVYKAWYPLTGRWLGFEEAEVTLSARENSFRAKFLVPGPTVGGTPLTHITGRWHSSGGLVLTSTAVPTFPHPPTH
ncbi:4'-phosphopantetheinyl transferase [Streptomyces sp. NPDC058001]|uniref:4'-phosphopantetheinyl transferase family protein n=1 Tax=Streptomyces sp. NPDC058001 TaxID=3346300 RepID=UPI0036EAA322